MTPHTLEHAREVRVLVVEDERRLRELLLKAIPDMGFRTKATASAEAALEAMEDQVHDIVLLDLNLPGMQGMDFFGQLRERWTNTQVVILTGYGDLEAARQAIRLDVADFLTKPASLGEIERSLERARRRLRGDSSEPMSENDRSATASMPEPDAEVRPLKEVERQLILAALDRHHGNRAAAAAELGISVRKLYYRLAEYERQPLQR
ncbi:MAG TPA: response regulator [Phycisphaerae bacterium]|nr:response regulator [Phycisphaerae bacterium]